MAAYVIARITVKDPEQYEVYKSLAPIAIKKYGGQFVLLEGLDKPLW